MDRDTVLSPLNTNSFPQCQRSSITIKHATRVLSPPNPNHVIRVRRVPIRMLKTTVCLMNVYFICWLPYQITVIWYFIDRDSYAANLPIVHFLHLLMVLNSVINPWIYGLYAAEIQPHLRQFNVHACFDTVRFLMGCENCITTEGSSVMLGSNRDDAANKYG